MTFSFGYQILNYSILWMITQSVRLKTPLKNSLAPQKKKVKQPLTVLYQTKGLLLNHEKLQAVVVNRNNEMKDSYSVNINQEVTTLKTVGSCLVLKLTISFLLKKRISRLVKKASNQLNPISRIQKFMGLMEREILLNSSFYSIFNYCSLV